MNAIITGATGFIGSWLAIELLNNGYNLTLIVRNRKKLVDEINKRKNVELIEKDIIDLSASDFSLERYDCCFNLAWEGVSSCQKDNLEIQLGNINNAIHLIEVCSRIKCLRFVSAGTVAEYALCNDIMDYSLKQTPNDIYGATKAAVHYYLEVRARQLGIPFNWIILPSTFGERRTDDNIITYTITSLLKQKKPLFGDLNQLWDFLYVGEVVKALRLICEKGKTNKTYGIGSGDFRTLESFICTVRDLINPKLELGIGEIKSMNSRSNSSCVNNFDLILDTGYKCSIDFEAGIKKTIDWYKMSLD